MGKYLARALNFVAPSSEQPGVKTIKARTAVAVGLLALLGIALPAAPAAADVAVTPTGAVQGGGADVTLSITNESPTASITAVEVQLPAETPIAEVYPLSVADWAPALTYAKVDK